MLNLKESMDNWISYIEYALDERMPEQGQLPPVIFEAMRYSLLGGGKRLRPMLMLSACEAVGGKREDAEPFACAMEMIHTYSLIHDDLPAMDNDDYRRGKPTNHKVFGEDMAILAGDGLLHQAMEVMAGACKEKLSQKTVDAMYIIARGAGIHGMVAGQVVDVHFEGTPLDDTTLTYIHENKTAALIRSSLEAGAVLGGADDETVKQFAQAGKQMGIAFQVIDDILDVQGDFEKLGKPIHSDEKNQKTTFVTLYGIERSQEIARTLSEEAQAVFADMGEQGEFLCELTQYLCQRSF